MKELSIEEKARRYDEALQRTRKWYDTNTNEGYRGIFEDIFPELRDSEDEGIREDIIRCLKYCGIKPDRPINPHVKTTMKDAIAWLEKQSEQKEYTFKSLPRLLDMIEPTSKAKAYCQKLIDTLVKERYSTDAKIKYRKENKLWNSILSKIE